jgi:hypothetical protein
MEVEYKFLDGAGHRLKLPSPGDYTLNVTKTEVEVVNNTVTIVYYVSPKAGG